MHPSARRVDFAQGYHVQLRAALNGGEGTLMTLSEGGAYVATGLNLLPQAQLHVTIQVPELKRTVEVEAVVAWENRGKERPSSQPEGYGLRFIRVPSASAEAIRWLLHRSDTRERDPERTQALSPAEVREVMAQVSARSGEDTDTVPPPADPSEEPEGPPFRLDAAVIRSQVPLSAPGVFVLAYDRTMEARIGRADVDLRKSLSEFIGKYAFFHFEVIPARKDRFERECELFHRYGGDRNQLDNDEHPLPPPGPQLKCPICAGQAS